MVAVGEFFTFTGPKENQEGKMFVISFIFLSRAICSATIAFTKFKVETWEHNDAPKKKSNWSRNTTTRSKFVKTTTETKVNKYSKLRLGTMNRNGELARRGGLMQTLGS